MSPKNIVILGAGFGGLRTVITLVKQLSQFSLEEEYRIILVDRNNYHTFTPLLYEVATTQKDVAEGLELKSLVTYPLDALIKNKTVTLLQDEVFNLDLARGEVHLRSSKVQFDFLVLALGSETNYFDIPGLPRYAIGLKTFDDAIRLRDALIILAERGRGSVVVGGGGSTGVELAGEIKHWLSQVEKNSPSPCKFRVVLIEGTKTILIGFDTRVIEKVTQHLRRLGVLMITETPIENIEENKVILQNNTTLPFDILVWTGGIKAISLTQKLSLKQEERGRIEIIGALECIPESPDLKIYGHIYAIGDITCAYDPKTNKPIPSIARAAIDEADIVAKNIIEEIKKERRLTKKTITHIYKPKDYPYIIPVGGKFAVAKIGPFIISGFLAWVLKGFVELHYLISIMPFWKALRIWLKGLKVFVQNDRLG